jgi:hypothetical protein
MKAIVTAFLILLHNFRGEAVMIETWSMAGPKTRRSRRFPVTP